MKDESKSMIKKAKKATVSTPVLRRSKVDIQVRSTIDQFKCIVEETKPVGEFLNELAGKTAIMGKSKAPSKRFLLSISRDLALCSSVIGTSVHKLVKNAEVTSPLPDMFGLYKRREVSSRRSMKQSSSLPNQTFKNKVQLALDKESTTNQQPRRSKRVVIKKNNRKNTLSFQYPKELNGLFLSPKETWTILKDKQKKHGKKFRAFMMKEMLEREAVGVKHLKPLYALYNKESVDRCPATWGERGIPRHVSHSKMKSFFSSSLKCSSSSVGQRDIEEMVDQGKQHSARMRGLVLTGDSAKASPSTYRRYIREIAVNGILNGSMSICRKDNITTEVRDVAGRLFRSATSFVISVCEAHFIVGEAPPSSTFAQLRHRLGTDATNTIKRIENSLQVPVYPINPENVLSTDDTTEFIFAGVKRTGDPWRIVEQAALSKKGIRSFNHVEPDNAKFGGFRVKLSVTISAAGQLARLVIIVSSLSKEFLKLDEVEVKRHRGVCVLKVEGLSMNGAVCPDSKDYGYIVFLLKDPLAEQSRHSFYDENILQKFVKANIERRRILMGIPLDSPRKNHETVATWRDGDLPQINALLSSGRLDAANDQYMQYMKQSASRSNNEQAADLSSMFKIVHKLNSFYSSKDKPLCQVQLLVEQQLNAEPHLDLKYEMKKALLDFVGQIGSIMINAATPRIIKQGFLANGMIDEKTETCPGIDKMLGTLTRALSQTEMDLFDSNFSRLLQKQLNYGHITDHDYDEMGFPDDIGTDGGVIKRYSETDSRKRACKLNHTFANNKRKEALFEQKRMEHTKKETLVRNIQAVLDSNKECESAIINYMSHDDGIEVHNIVQAQMKHFAKCTVARLVNFIFARVLTDLLSSDTKKTYFIQQSIRTLPNKRTLLEATQGMDCLILRAYNLRNERIKLNVPDMPVLDLSVVRKRWEGPVSIDLSYHTSEINFKVAKVLLGNVIWLVEVRDVLNPKGNLNINHLEREISKNDFDTVEKLESLLFARLPEHVARKVDDKGQSSWVWGFVKKIFQQFVS